MKNSEQRQQQGLERFSRTVLQELAYRRGLPITLLDRIPVRRIFGNSTLFAHADSRAAVIPLKAQFPRQRRCNGRLIILVDGVAATEVMQMQSLVIDYANRLFGYVAIDQLRARQMSSFSGSPAGS